VKWLDSSEFAKPSSGFWWNSMPFKIHTLFCGHAHPTASGIWEAKSNMNNFVNMHMFSSGISTTTEYVHGFIVDQKNKPTIPKLQTALVYAFIQTDDQLQGIVDMFKGNIENMILVVLKHFVHPLKDDYTVIKFDSCGDDGNIVGASDADLLWPCFGDFVFYNLVKFST